MAAIDTTQNIAQVTSTVPLVQIPPQDLQRGQPLPTSAGYMGKAGSIASIGDSLAHGLLKGLAVKEQRKAATAQVTIDALDKANTAAFGNYQQVAAEKGVDSTEGKAAYDAYLAQFNQAKEQKAKFLIPDEKAKKKPNDKKQTAAEKFGGGLKQFFERNPHIIPEISLMAMQPQKPGLTTDTQKTQNQLTEQKQGIELNQQNLEANKRRAAQDEITQRDVEMRKKVDAAGGIDAVVNDKNAPQDLREAARRGVAERLDKEGPDGQLRDKFARDVLTGNTSAWTPADRQVAAHLGYASEPREVTSTGTNGHSVMTLVDPSTNQPIPGSKPLDLGPPAWAQQFYAERAAQKSDIRSAVAKNPETYGITLTGDKQTDMARIDAASTRLFAESEEHIRATAGLTSRTGFEVQRDNAILKDATGDIMKQIPKKGTADFVWTNGQKVSLDQEQMKGILGQFMTDPQETPGNYAFRNQAKIPDGKDPQAAERDRQWAYNLVKNRMMSQPGKKAMTAQEADAILSKTALGTPITATAAPRGTYGQTTGGFGDWWKHEMKPGWFGGSDQPGPGGMSGPPQQSAPGVIGTPGEGKKLYAVPGEDGSFHPVYLNDDQLQQAVQQGLKPELVPDSQ